MSKSTFSINAMRFNHDAYELVIELESDHYGRSYRCTWNPTRADSMAMLAHWDESCEESNADLSPNEARDVERFLDASDEVTEAFIELADPMLDTHVCDNECDFCAAVDVLQEVEEHGVPACVCWRCAAQVEVDICA
jgi:hypothetical protein